MIFEKVVNQKEMTLITQKSNLKTNDENFVKNIEKLKNDTSKEISIEKKDILKEIAKELNKSETFINNKIQFDYNEEANVFVVLIKDMENEKILKQFPTEEFIKRLIYYREIEEKNLALLLDEKI